MAQPEQPLQPAIRFPEGTPLPLGVQHPAAALPPKAAKAAAGAVAQPSEEGFPIPEGPAGTLQSTAAALLEAQQLPLPLPLFVSALLLPLV